MKISFNDIQQTDNNYSANKTDYKVKLFSLKPDETAIVRFLISSTDDFEIFTDHNNIEYDDKKYQKVNCIRAASDPISKCPLCEANYSIEQIIFFRMLQYVTDENGNVSVIPVIWSRNIKSAIINNLVQYLNTYGDLSAIVCAISRTGSGLDTKFTISPNLPAARYPDNVYVNDPSGFEDYNVLGSLIKDWDAEQMAEFIQTGSNPVHRENKPQFTQVNNTMVPNTDINDDALPFNEPAAAVSNTEPVVTNNPIPPITTRNMNPSFTPMNRPQRTYN